jgi:hypothetical protein
MSQLSPVTPTPSTNLQLSNSFYDKLKRVTTTILPAVSTLYFTLAQIWGLPAAEQVVGTIAALNLFLGLALSVSGRSYNSDDKYAGTVTVDPDAAEGVAKVLFNVTSDLATLDEKQKEVRFQVKPK